MAQAQAASASRPSTFAVLRRRSFSMMWLGELISTIGSSFTAIAAGILIYRVTDSALAVGLMLAATIAPSLLIGLIAGVFVDRYDRKRIMIAGDISRGLLIALIPFLVGHSVYWLYVIVFATSTIQQFFDPAKESVIPELAPDDELEAANSLLAISSFGSTAVGFGAAGLLASTDIYLAFFIDAASFFVSALMISLVHFEHFTPEGETNVRTVVRNLGEGIAFLWASPVLRSLIMISALYALAVGLWNSLLLPFCLTALKATEFEYGLQEGLTSVGFVIGSLFFARFAMRLYDGQWIALSLFGMGLTGTLYAFSSNVWFAILVLGFSGFLNAPYGIGKRTLIQRHTTREIRGRVASVYFVAGSVFFLPGMLLAGLADVLDIRWLVFASAIAQFGAMGLALVLPGIGRPAADWRRALTVLRGAAAAPEMSAGRAATLADFDRLAGVLPLLARLGPSERATFIAGSRLRDALAGTSVVRIGEESTAAYFVIEGRLVAGAQIEGEERILSTMNAGDFFGEIAALTGRPRTANVLATEESELLEVTAQTLRSLMDDPAIAKVVSTTMAERLARTGIADLPRFNRPDQVSMRDLRTERVEGPTPPESSTPASPEAAPVA